MANAHSQTHASAQAIAQMSSFTALGGSPEWRSLLPTDITDVLATTETAVHDTIDPSNQFEAGSLVSVTCDPKLRAGFTSELADLIIPAALRTQWTPLVAAAAGPRSLRATAARPTSATSAHFVVPTMASALAVSTLVYVSGCAIAANNGLKVVNGSPSTTTIPVAGLTAETFTAGQNVTLEVCGFQFASGDCTITVSGSTITIGTTVKDLTELGLVSGQSIMVGESSNAAYSFATAASNGPGRIVSAPTANALVLEMMHTTAVTDAGASKTIRIMFGQTCRAVARTHTDYLEPWFQLETSVENLGAADAESYLYNEQCAVNTMTAAFPSSALATLSADMIATDTARTDTRRTNAATPTLAKRTIPFNTTSDISGRVFLASAGTAATGVITAVNLIIENQATRTFGHGALAAQAITFGKIRVRIELTVFLTESNLLDAARANTDLKANWWIRNAECAYAFDVPSCRAKISSGDWTKAGVITMSTELMANKDGTWATSLIVSKVPGCSALPTRA